MDPLIKMSPRLKPGSRRSPAHELAGFRDLLIPAPKNAIRNIPANRRRKKTAFEVFIVLACKLILVHRHAATRVPKLKHRRNRAVAWSAFVVMRIINLSARI